MSEPAAPVVSDDALRAAVESAATYKAAALALRLPYGVVYARAHKLRCYPKSIAEKRADKEKMRDLRREAWTPEPPKGSPIDPSRLPVPEPVPPVLSPWVAPGRTPMPNGAGTPREREDVAAVRVDQHGRVRATVTNLRDGWASWAIYDAAGNIIGKLGIRGGMRSGEGRLQAEEGADAALVELGWLPTLHVPPTNPCASPAPACCSEAPPALPPGHEPVRRALDTAAATAVSNGWTEGDFLLLARITFLDSERGKDIR